MIQYGLYRTPRIRQRFAEATTASNNRGNDGVREEVEAGVHMSARRSPTLPTGPQQLQYAGAIPFAFNRRAEIEVMLKTCRYRIFSPFRRVAQRREVLQDAILGSPRASRDIRPRRPYLRR
jgi:hypothetical protein